MKGYLLYVSNYLASKKEKTMETVKRQVVSRGWRETGMIRSMLREVKLLCVIL